MRRFLLVALACIPLDGRLRAEGPLQIQSPDGRLTVQITLPRAGSGERPTWSASYAGKKILTDCQLSLEVAGGVDLLAGVRVTNQHTRAVDHSVPVLFGKADHARDCYREISLELENAQHWSTALVFRCYDEALAFRYEILKQKGKERLTVTEEGTSFGLVGNPRAFVQYLENYKTSHEHNVDSVRLADIKRDTLLDLPTTFAFDGGPFVAITEAALRRYAGMSLMRGDDSQLVSRLTPLPDGTKVVRALPMETPWRVVLVGDRPGGLLESNVIYCLNPPSSLADISWIKPGKMTWSWWNGYLYDPTHSAPILSLDVNEKYIDFCARNGIRYHSVIAAENDTPLYRQIVPGLAPGPGTDVTKLRPDLDLESIRRYAQSKGVGLWTWVHQGALRGRVEEAFAAFEKFGWNGMMVDFFDHDDQETVEFTEKILESAARHHILIHFHGIWKPTGVQRTYPNLMNHEGVLNLEYLKWSDRCTPEHDLLMAYTRLLAGPMDYHLGGFRAVTRADFKPKFIAPNVLGTRCHQLAMYVCFDNPNPMIADYPTAYDGQPGFDFITGVPTWWDETRVLKGEIGEILVTARRRGDTWYLGGMTGRRGLEMEVPLTILGAESYTAQTWQDAPDSAAHPNHLVTSTFQVAAGKPLKLSLAAGGGFVARIARAR